MDNIEEEKDLCKLRQDMVKIQLLQLLIIQIMTGNWVMNMVITEK